MAPTTRDKLLAQAVQMFADKGFYGTSINDVAAALGMSKQGLLHHFPTKEKLYAAVLQSACDHLLALLMAETDPDAAPADRLEAMLLAFTRTDEPTHQVVLLLMRELLDNQSRAEASRQWFLKPVLDRLEGLVREAQEQGEYQAIYPLAFVYQLLGAIQYFTISRPTLKKLYGKTRYAEHCEHHINGIRQMIQFARVS